jgi:hypothetical protein
MLGTIRKRLAAAGLPGDCASLRNPDTMTVLFPPAPLESHWPHAAIDGILLEGDFDGFDVEMRFSAREGGNKQSVPAWTLVARGPLRESKLLLKALWQANEGGDVERLTQHAAWRGEADCLLAMQHGRNSPVGPPTTSVQRPGNERFAVGLARLFMDLPGDNRVAGFARRLGIWGAAVAGCVFFLALASVGAGPLYWVCVFLTLIATLGLGLALLVKVFEIVIVHRWGRTLLQDLYSQSLTFPPVDLVAEGITNDPVAAKYSKELEELGAVHYFDSRSPAKTQTSYVRCYLLPGEHTYLMLNILFTFRPNRSYPAKPLLVAYACFSDGQTLLVGNSELRVRYPADPDVITRMHRDVCTLPDFLIRQREELRRQFDAGKQPAPVLTPQELMAKLADVHERTGGQLARRGYYSWREAAVQSFVGGQHDEP